MRWKISHWGHHHRGPLDHHFDRHLDHRGHDPRQLDLLTILALLILIVAAYRFYAGPAPTSLSMSFIEPSQTVRW